MELYKAGDVRTVCAGVTLRMLDYWVESDVIQPARYIDTNNRHRRIYLFSFEDIVRIKLVKSLREARVSLQQIRTVIRKLQTRRGDAWQSAWLITDGKKIYEATDDPATVKSLAKGETGQLAFSILAVGGAKQLIHKKLTQCNPVDVARYDGIVKTWRKSSLSP